MAVPFSTVWCLETVSAIEVPFSKYFHIRAPSRKWHPYVLFPAPAQCLRLLLLRASQSAARVLYFVLSYLISTSLVMENAAEFKTVPAKRFLRLFTVSSIIQCPPAGLTTLSPLTLCHRNARLEQCSLPESKIPSRLFQNEPM